MPLQNTHLVAFISSVVNGDIQAFRLDANGNYEPELLGRLSGVPGVMALCLGVNSNVLYATTRHAPYHMYSIALSGDGRTLTVLNRVPIDDDTVYLALDKTGRYVFSVSYDTGQLHVSHIDPESLVAGVPHQSIYVANKPHAVLVDPSNASIHVTCLAEDRVVTLRFDALKGRIDPYPIAEYKTVSGAGPRHMALAADAREIFVLNELNGTLDTFSLVPGTGTMETRHPISMLRQDSALSWGQPRTAGSLQALGRVSVPQIWAADIAVSPDGGYLYATERTSNCVSVIELKGRSLWTLKAIYPTSSQPRSLALSSDGRVLVVVGEKSEEAIAYYPSPEGQLDRRHRFSVGMGNWVVIGAYPQADNNDNNQR